MADLSIIGHCPACGAAIIADEPSVACDSRGRSTGDAVDFIDGSPQGHVGHPGCVTTAEPDPEE